MAEFERVLGSNIGERSMTPTKLLIGQILIVFAIVIGAMWGATQWTAGQFDYQPRLGPAWFEVAGYPLYIPWRLFE